ncbi:hypothetical protein BpHYR1_052367 [Brachionus plicatilis]|uniref:Uncharacterized protein n=1 Tax=Brachionus plicatilis TaxID=10195 RepID=A0A3M7QRG4_BRAPC|nr:hypothetical protein BpHYR1_052367 [Brachionus plicatilis]
MISGQFWPAILAERAVQILYLDNPKRTKDKQINEIYSTINSEQFLQFDNKDNSNRILLFMSPIGLKILALALVPLKDVQTCWNIILNTVPVIIDSDVLKSIKYFVNPWLQGKYGFSWHYFRNIGPRTNNHLEGYHAKLSSILSAKSNNSASQVHSEFHANERNQIAEPKQISKNKKKGQVFVTLQEQFSEQILTFEQYFDKLSANIIEPYGTSQMKFDQDEKDQNDDKVDSRVALDFIGCPCQCYETKRLNLNENRKVRLTQKKPLSRFDFLKTFSWSQKNINSVKNKN